MRSEYTPAQYQAALDDLERRGVVTVSLNERGEKQYHFPDAETGARLLHESRRKKPVRDPRIDPMPGGGISRDFPTALAGTILREVTRAHGGFVFFHRDNGYRSKPQIVSLTQWRKWAERSTVFMREGADA